MTVSVEELRKQLAQATASAKELEEKIKAASEANRPVVIKEVIAKIKEYSLTKTELRTAFTTKTRKAKKTKVTRTPEEQKKIDATVAKRKATLAAKKAS